MQKRNKGHILAIVLIIFMVLLQALLSYSSFLLDEMTFFKQQQILDTQRQTEIYFVRYLRETLSNDLLLSDDLRFDHGEIHYTVDHMGNYEEITATISSDWIDDYQMIIQLESSSLHIQSVDYK